MDLGRHVQYFLFGDGHYADNVLVQGISCPLHPYRVLQEGKDCIHLVRGHVPALREAPGPCCALREQSFSHSTNACGAGLPPWDTNTAETLLCLTLQQCRDIR